jgi:hypothetical protein
MSMVLPPTIRLIEIPTISMYDNVRAPESGDPIYYDAIQPYAVREFYLKCTKSVSY